MADISCRLSICTMSLGHGHAGHSLSHRLSLASRLGYRGIELFYDDLEHLAKSLPETSPHTSLPSPAPGTTALPTEYQLLRAASMVRDMCEQDGLTIICLQPFRHYEGLLDRNARAARLDELRLWCRLAGLLHTDLILIPSNFLPSEKLTTDVNVVVQDLRDAAAVAAAARPAVRLCYEALAWGTRVDTWQQSWDIVRAVDRVNFGLCLDTFNMAARVYADPAVAGGIRPGGLSDMESSLRELTEHVDISRVFLVQIADGARLDAPLRQGHPLYDPAMPSRMSWSRNHRLFYGETDHGAYLPVRLICQAIFGDLGYRGWVSHELFNKRMSDTEPEIPEEMAKRGVESWKKLVHDLQLPTGDDNIKHKEAWVDNEEKKDLEHRHSAGRADTLLKLPVTKWLEVCGLSRSG